MNFLSFSEDDYELPNQPMWHKEQLVKFDDIRDRRERASGQSSNSDDDQVSYVCVWDYVWRDDKQEFLSIGLDINISPKHNAGQTVLIFFSCHNENNKNDRRTKAPGSVYYILYIVF